jgi:hypothetical protein
MIRLTSDSPEIKTNLLFRESPAWRFAVAYGCTVVARSNGLDTRLYQSRVPAPSLGVLRRCQQSGLSTVGLAISACGMPPSCKPPTLWMLEAPNQWHVSNALAPARLGTRSEGNMQSEVSQEKSFGIRCM